MPLQGVAAELGQMGEVFLRRLGVERIAVKDEVRGEVSFVRQMGPSPAKLPEKQGDGCPCWVTELMDGKPPLSSFPRHTVGRNEPWLVHPRLSNARMTINALKRSGWLREKRAWQLPATTCKKPAASPAAAEDFSGPRIQGVFHLVLKLFARWHHLICPRNFGLSKLENFVALSAARQGGLIPSWAVVVLSL